MADETREEQLQKQLDEEKAKAGRDKAEPGSREEQQQKELEAERTRDWATRS